MDFVFNVSKGAVAYLAGLPAANDALIAIPLEATGIESDATLRDYDDVAALLAASNNEQTVLGRKTITSVTVTVDDANDRVDVDMADLVWAGSAGNDVSDIVIAYDGDTTGGTDANLRLLTCHDFAVEPDGSDVTGTVNVFYRAS